MSERPLDQVVALRDRGSGRYLVAGAGWSTDAASAVLLAELEAIEVVRRFSCEPHAIELVPSDALEGDTACRAVA